MLDLFIKTFQKGIIWFWLYVAWMIWQYYRSVFLSCPSYLISISIPPCFSPICGHCNRWNHNMLLIFVQQVAFDSLLLREALLRMIAIGNICENQSIPWEHPLTMTSMGGGQAMDNHCTIGEDLHVWAQCNATTATREVFRVLFFIK